MNNYKFLSENIITYTNSNLATSSDRTSQELYAN
jgi:hypothetical protein